MKHTVLVLTSPRRNLSYEITLCDAYKPDRENVLRQILEDGGGVT